MSVRDEEPPEVETRQIIRWITEPASAHRGSPHAESLEKPIRPALRPSVPVLTVLDDGTFADGESFRLRGERFLIGRSEGDLMIPSDRTLSGHHAEIRRIVDSGRASWVLVDLDTANGTFVRVKSAAISADTIVVLGCRRYRLVQPFTADEAQPRGSTMLLDKWEPPLNLWPALTETATTANSQTFPLNGPEVTIGRLGGGSTISIDDSHLAEHHATFARAADDVWRIYAGQTENGVWVSVRSVSLTSHCYFRCGEQFFRFLIP